MPSSSPSSSSSSGGGVLAWGWSNGFCKAGTAARATLGISATTPASMVAYEGGVATVLIASAPAPAAAAAAVVRCLKHVFAAVPEGCEPLVRCEGLVFFPALLPEAHEPARVHGEFVVGEHGTHG
mmetsp:Transcript_14344/g.29410  ORF Transcript_14344/g.29410 Transcript_14344/m.29410 type:complete len:125 (+) Transcript_14344:746-1120(+)